ncbi:hypothetical protein NST84_12915 [Paenibacillus sp. FSL R7-0345]|uniref:hypothetical protein n=1 Tax=Paenibacillus sp. FSL R7-0345 TaxID=2954535 RepID=UPI00315AB245
MKGINALNSAETRPDAEMKGTNALDSAETRPDAEMKDINAFNSAKSRPDAERRGTNAFDSAESRPDDSGVLYGAFGGKTFFLSVAAMSLLGTVFGLVLYRIYGKRPSSKTSPSR